MALAVKTVVIGASAGAIQALLQILPMLPADFDAAVLVVVHVPPGRQSEISGLFASKCALPVCEGEDKQPITAGQIIFAPADYHMQVEGGGTISLSSDEPIFFSRPAIDVLFETAADAYDTQLLGVILTGANQDGAQGLAAVAKAGGMALVQDPATAYARAMPDAAIKACPEAQVCSLEAILDTILQAGGVKCPT